MNIITNNNNDNNKKIKDDPEINQVAAEAAYLITKAAELFTVYFMNFICFIFLLLYIYNNLMYKRLFSSLVQEKCRFCPSHNQSQYFEGH